MYLFDTNVISEFRNLQRNRAHPAFAAWATVTDIEQGFVSVITLHELEYGVRLLERRDPRQAAPLRAWLTEEGLPRWVRACWTLMNASPGWQPRFAYPTPSLFPTA